MSGADDGRAAGGAASPAEPAATAGPAETAGDRPGGLLPAGELAEIDGQWRDIQARFVDDPRQAVRDAGDLAAGLLQRLTEQVASQRSQLESLPGPDGTATEELRQGLRRYRALCDRLLAG